MDMGKLVADNIRSFVRGRPLLSFRASQKPTLIALGDLSTFLVSSRFALSGIALAPAKEAIYQLTMTRFDTPTHFGGLSGLVGRLGKGIRDFGLSGFPSLGRLQRLTIGSTFEIRIGLISA